MEKNINETISYRRAESIRHSEYFKKTNSIWNYNNLNRTYCIGNLMYLISLSNATSPKEFEKWYIENGEKRELCLLNVSNYTKNALNSFVNNKTIEKSYMDINKKYGRNVEYLNHLTIRFYNLIKRRYPDWNISVYEVKEFVYIRLFYETYLGYQREILTIERLKGLYPYLRFEKTDLNFDTRYSVDVEVYDKDELICGLQIKSSNYRLISNTTYSLHTTNQFNKTKHQEYQTRFRKPVYYVFSKVSGYIVNKEEIDLFLPKKKKSSFIQ